MEFKQRELVFTFVELDVYSPQKSLTLPLLHKGVKCELGYEEGDKVLFDVAAAEEREIEGKKYYILTSEAKAICKL